MEQQVQFDEVIMKRRSIRGYKPDPVPQEVIREVVRLATRAPSSMNTPAMAFSCGDERAAGQNPSGKYRAEPELD